MFLIVVVLFGLLTGAIADKKGHSFVLWALFGAALFIIALPCVLLLKAKPEAIEAKRRPEGMKKCPACAEMVQGAAVKCRYCGTDLA